MQETHLVTGSRVVLMGKQGPLFESKKHKDVKDPCPVFDGVRWHIYGSGGDVRSERWSILHATSPELLGPWTEAEDAVLRGVAGDHVAAPGVVHDGGEFHMFVQTEFMGPSGTVEHLVSSDGSVFERRDTALRSVPGTDEAGIYDPHPAVIRGDKYIVYSGSPRVDAGTGAMGPGLMRPDICLAASESGTWAGPWKRLGKILDHEAIREHHNQHDHPEYEWGIEGPQLIELSSGKILLNATCFLPHGRFGTRQRVFFAVADDVSGPYKTMGPVFAEGLGEWESGETGHAAGVMTDGVFHLFYQGRSMSDPDPLSNNWKYGIAAFDLSGA